MKKKRYFITILLLTIHCSLFTAYSQSWRELMDSTKAYMEKQDIQKAIDFAKVSLDIAKKELGQLDTNLIGIVQNLSYLYWQSGNYLKSLEYARIDSSITVKSFGKESNKYIQTSLSLAVQYKELKLYDLAEKSFLESIEIGRRIFNGIDNFDFTNCLNETAIFYATLGQYKKAEPYYIEALELRRRLFKTEHPSLAESINNLGYFYATIGDFNKAEPLFIEALEMYRHICKDDDPNLAVSIGNMAAFYQNIGDLKKVGPLLEESLEMSRRVYKSDHLYLVISISNLAMFYKSIGDFNKARPLLKEALEISRRIYKEDNPDLARCINNMANFYVGLGDYEQVEPLLIEVFEMSRRIYKNDHPDLAMYIGNMGFFYFTKGDFIKAEPLLIEALEIRRRFFKGDNPNLAASINNLASFYSSTGDFKQAEILYKEAHDMNRRLYKGDHPNLAASLNNLANFYKESGDYKQAEILVKESLDMSRRLFKGDHPDLAKVIRNTASFFTVIGNYKQAEALYKEALEMNRRLFKNDNPDLAICINSMASFFNEMGNYSEAEPLLKEALEMSRRIFKNDHPDLDRFLTSMANFYFDRGDFKHSEPLYKETLEMNRRLYEVDHSILAQSINNIAGFYLATGDYTLAESLFKEALEMKRRLHKSDNFDLANGISNMSNLYNSKGDYKKAEPLSKEALEMERRLHKNDHLDLAASINNLAVLYRNIGEYNEAEPLFKESLDMYRRLFKNDHPTLAYMINNIASFYSVIGKYNQAEPFYKEAIEMYRRIYKIDHPDFAKSIIYLANIYTNQGNVTDAEPLLTEGIQIYQKVINYNFPIMSEAEKSKFFNQYKSYFEEFNNFALHRYKGNPQVLCKMYDYNLYTKSLIFNSTSKTKRSILNSNDSVLISQYRKWLDMRSFLGKLYNMTTAEVKKKNFNIDSIEKTANDIEKELSMKSEAYTQSYEKKKYDWKKIQGILKPDEAAIETIRVKMNTKSRPGDTTQVPDTAYYAFLIVTEQTEEYPDIVIQKNAVELETKYFNNYKNSIKFKTSDNESFTKYWSALYEKTKSFKKIFFSPEGVFNNINPATILLPNGKYLLDEQDIQYVNSTKDILLDIYRSKKETNILNSAVLIGNPEFNLTPEQVKQSENDFVAKRTKEEERGLLNLSPLPGTEKEVNNIADFLKSKSWRVSTYTKDKAIKSVLANSENPRVIHIATHGMFLKDIGIKEDENEKLYQNPLLRSGLFFAGANKFNRTDNICLESENGLLTAYEAMNLNLDKTELVVLSACETGLGEIQNGEGVFGLRRAFQQAGARTIMMSLWTVNDEATQELMSNFYKNWVSGMTKRESFGNAQKELKKKYPEPYYWGAFVMVGE